MSELHDTKIALCYSGLPNLDLFAIETFLNKIHLDPSKMDLICCFWNVNEDRKKIDSISKKFNNAFVLFVNPEVPDLEFLNEYFKFPETNVGRVISMLFIRKQLLGLINSLPSSYDSYIFSRPDIFVTLDLRINKILQNLGKKYHIYFPYAGNYRNGLTDTLALADYSGLEIYLSAFDRLTNILSSKNNYIFPKTFMGLLREVYCFFNLLLTGRCRHLMHTVPLHPEVIMKKNIEMSGLQMGFFDVGDIIISRGHSKSRLGFHPQASSFLLARSLIRESISSVDLSVNAVFNSKRGS